MSTATSATAHKVTDRHHFLERGRKGLEKGGGYQAQVWEKAGKHPR